MFALFADLATTYRMRQMPRDLVFPSLSDSQKPPLTISLPNAWRVRCEKLESRLAQPSPYLYHACDRKQRARGETAPNRGAL